MNMLILYTVQKTHRNLPTGPYYYMYYRVQARLNLKKLLTVGSYYLLVLRTTRNSYYGS
eukprot:COSAG05_NODE_48_length_24425_cov_90.438543_25_plen_59_part_00